MDIKMDISVSNEKASNNNNYQSCDNVIEYGVSDYLWNILEHSYMMIYIIWMKII